MGLEQVTQGRSIHRAPQSYLVQSAGAEPLRGGVLRQRTR